MKFTAPEDRIVHGTERVTDGVTDTVTDAECAIYRTWIKQTLGNTGR